MIISKETALKRLREKEVWPFNEADNGCLKIQADRYYGFYDAGGVTDNRGYATLDEALADVHKQCDDAYSDTMLVTTDASKLGEYLVTVLTGRQFIDRLYELTDYNEELFNDYGTWTVESNS